MAISKYRICLVEDNPDHANLIILALKKLKEVQEVQHSPNAISFLSMLNQFEQSSLPDLLLLDLELPKMNGFELLTYLKTNSKFQYIPVVILTSSVKQEHREKAFALGAKYYLEKTADFKELSFEIRLILHQLGEKIAARDDDVIKTLHRLNNPFK